MQRKIKPFGKEEMKLCIFLSLIIFTIFFYQRLCYSQDSTSVNIKNSIAELNQLKQDIQNQNEKTRLLLNESERNFELASKIIDWSAMFFATLVVFLGVAGWIGARRFKQIDETGKEMATLLEKMKSELQQMQRLRDENQRAIDELKERIEKERKEFMEVIYHMSQGENAFEKGELEEAIKAYTKVITLKFDSPEAHFMLGNTYSANGDYDDAIRHLKKAIELKPNYYEAFYNLGRTYRRYGDHDLSIEYLKKSLEFNPKYVNSTTNIGHAYLRKGEPAKAKEWYQKSIAIDPNAPLAYIGLARIAYLQSEIEKALEQYNIAKEKIEGKINRRRFRYWDIYHLAEIHLVLNKIQQAESYYNQAFAMNAAKETLRAIKYDLELLKSSANPPTDIDKFIKIFNEKLGQ